MNDNKEIFLPETNLKLGVLKKKLNEVYGLEVIEKKKLYLLLGIVAGISIFLVVRGVIKISKKV